MGKIPYTTSEQEVKRRVAKSMINAKVSRKKIVKAVRVSDRTVRRLRTRRAKRKKGSGRRENLSAGQKIGIKNSIYANPFQTP